MKKLVLALSFVFVLGLIAVNAQDQKKEVKKAPAKTEAPAAKPVKKAVKAKKEAAPVKKEATPVKK
jgi:hypothetical protein